MLIRQLLDTSYVCSYMQKWIGLILVAILMASCGAREQKAQTIVDAAIKAHGQHRLEKLDISFLFRDRRYTATRSDDQYVYTRSFRDSLDFITDSLVNSSDFTRWVNGQKVNVVDSMAQKYANSINSVLYFVQLPYLLNDPAVNKAYMGTQEILDEPYHVVKVSFKPQNGGEDFQDVYMYWFHEKSNLMDYLAYSYETEGGGVRFREAYNRFGRHGLIFQDYVNYEVPIGAPLSEIPELFERNKLKELSRIVNEKVRVSKSSQPL